MRSLTRPHCMGYERQQAATLTKLWGKIRIAPKLRVKIAFEPETDGNIGIVSKSLILILILGISISIGID